jgi:hypothetical protein
MAIATLGLPKGSAISGRLIGNLRHCWSNESLPGATKLGPYPTDAARWGSLPANCSCAYRYAATRTLRNSHRGPLTRWKHSHLRVTKVCISSRPPHHETIKSYRELCNSRAPHSDQTIELFGLLQAGHYSPGCAQRPDQRCPPEPKLAQLKPGADTPVLPASPPRRWPVEPMAPA